MACLVGCGSTPGIGASLAGINIEDLKALQPSSPSKAFDLTYQETYDLMLKKVYDNSLFPYMQSQKEGYIIVIGLKKQVNTTRVGIFIKSVSETATRVTLTSKSSTALDKAQLIFFDKTENDVTVIE
jgi:hypothetical protein